MPYDRPALASRTERPLMALHGGSASRQQKYTAASLSCPNRP